MRCRGGCCATGTRARSRKRRSERIRLKSDLEAEDFRDLNPVLRKRVLLVEWDAQHPTVSWWLRYGDAEQGDERMNGSVDRLLQLLAEKGTRQYGGERVSQCE